MGQKGHVINKHICLRERERGDGSDKTEKGKITALEDI